MASRWSEKMSQLRRLWRMPADVAQAEQAAWQSSQRLSTELAALAERVDSAEALAGLRQDIGDLRQDMATLRRAVATPPAELMSLLTQLRQPIERQQAGLEAMRVAADAARDAMGSRLAELLASMRQSEMAQAGLGEEVAAVKAVIGSAEAARLASSEQAAALQAEVEAGQRASEAAGAELAREVAALHAALEAARLMLGGEIAAVLPQLETARAQLDGRIAAVSESGERQQAEIARRFHRVDDLGFDQLAMLARGSAPAGLRMVAEKPVALDSADHLHPRGTAADDTRHPRFVAACETLFPGRTLHYLDLGCAGGGLVWDFLTAGHQSYGVEGSDYSQRSRRAYWRVAPDRYFTADITRPFQLLRGDGMPAIFEIITAWEVLEHIGEADLAGLFGNIRQALTADGVFLASVASFEDRDPASGTPLHVTLQPREWWLERAAENGLRPVSRPVPFVLEDFARGSGNPRMNDWDARWEPSWGFHLMLEAAP